MHSRTLLLIMVLCIASACVIRGQSLFCLQTPSEASDACKFECQHGYERDVALELERLSHENSRCRQNGIFASLLPTVEFTNRTIAARWFNGDVRVIQLELDLRNIDRMQPYSFEADAFSSVAKLTLRRLGIAELQRNVFAGLPVLRELNFHELVTRSFIPGWLASVGATLELLLVYGPGQPTFNLNGLTMTDATMTALRYIHYSLNLDASIDGRTFRGVSSVQTLELSSCSIETIGVGAFNSLGNRLQLLKLDKNRLRQLPAGIFDRLLPSSAGLTVFLDSNQWDCRCGLEYLQFVLRARRQMFHGDLRCATPAHFAHLTIETTEFCVNGEEVVAHKNLRCENDEFEEVAKQIAHRDHHVRLMPADDGLQVAHNRQSSDPWLLVRLSVAGYTVNPTNADDEWRMGCVYGYSNRSRLGSRLAENLPHLLCLMGMSSPLLSPLDCTAYWPEPVDMRPTTWLPNTDKPDVATTLAFGMVGCFIVGALIPATVFAFVRNSRGNHDASQPAYPDMEEVTSVRNDYAELPYAMWDSAPLQSSLAFRFLMQLTPPPQYVASLQRCNSDPLLVYQSQFDVVPAARSNSLIYVYSSRFDVVPEMLEAKPVRRASIGSIPI